MSDVPLTAGAAGAYRLSTAGGRVRWTRDHTEVAYASWREQWWDLHDAGDDRVVLSMVGGSVAGRTRVALLDRTTRRAATFATAEPMTRSHIGVLRDTWDAVLMVVRADGPSGLHIVDPTGEPLALTSRRRSADGPGCDVLVTTRGAAGGTELIFGVGLVLELLRVGGLRRVA